MTQEEKIDHIHEVALRTGTAVAGLAVVCERIGGDTRAIRAFLETPPPANSPLLEAVNAILAQLQFLTEQVMRQNERQERMAGMLTEVSARLNGNGRH